MWRLAVVLLGGCDAVLGIDKFPVPTGGAIEFVQLATLSSNPVVTLSADYVNAQAAGDLNVVFVSWTQSPSPPSITDAAGNTYMTAGPDTSTQSYFYQAMFYAENISTLPSGANTVTATFASSTANVELRVLEYTGIATSGALDGAHANVGNGAMMDSGAIATTAPYVLLVAGANVSQHSTAAGPGYTLREITDPFGNLVEDMTVVTAGSYTATGTQAPAGIWLMQVAAFEGANPAAAR